MRTTPKGHRLILQRMETLAAMNDETPTLRAYVLEDDPDIAALEADLLREMGFVVVTCTRIVELGGYATPGTSSNFANSLANEIDKWGKVIKFSGARVD